MKTVILFLFFGIPTIFCNAQKERIENKMADCLYQSYNDDGEALKLLILDYEQLLINEKFLIDSSGKSYREAYEIQFKNTTTKMPSKIFMKEFLKLEALDFEKRAKCIKETEKDSLNYDSTTFKAFIKIANDNEQMDLYNVTLVEGILSTLKDDDLELDFYKIITFTLLETINKDSFISKKLSESKEKQYSEKEMSNALNIHLNEISELIIDNEVIQLKKLKSLIIAYLKSSRSKAIISFTNEPETLYKTYIEVQNEIIASYNFVRNQLSQEKYETSFEELTTEQAQDIIKICPKNFIEGQN